MKKLLSLLLVLCVAALPALSLAEAQTEIIVFAAASMTETLTEIKALYEAAHPGIVRAIHQENAGHGGAVLLQRGGGGLPQGIPGGGVAVPLSHGLQGGPGGLRTHPGGGGII